MPRQAKKTTIMNHSRGRPSVLIGDVVSGGIIKKNRAVVLDQDRIRSILPAGDIADEVQGAIRAPEGLLITASFIDLQINGAGGVCFQSDPTEETLVQMQEALARFGVAYFAPTIVSAEIEHYRVVRNVFRKFIGRSGSLAAINFEGPFINPARAGIHDPSFIRRLDDTWKDICYDMAADTKVIMTVAPEQTDGGLLLELVREGIIVSAGHSNATSVQAEAFFDFGVSNVTHLFNGMNPISGREPGLAGLSLSRPDIYCSVIADGHHLHPQVLDLIWRMKGRGRMYLISDGMPPLGGADETFDYQGHTISNKDGALVDEKGVLSGTTVPINVMARKLREATGARIEKIIGSISSVPAAVIGCDKDIGDIRVGMRASLNIIDRDFDVKYATRDGVCIFDEAAYV